MAKGRSVDARARRAAEGDRTVMSRRGFLTGAAAVAAGAVGDDDAAAGQQLGVGVRVVVVRTRTLPGDRERRDLHADSRQPGLRE